MNTEKNDFRILIVEDEVVIARTIEYTLNKHFNCQPRFALTIDEAQKMAYRQLPHLVLCDINLNDNKTGINFIQEMQQALCFETIFITAYASKNVFDEATSVSPANYLIKPFDENQLVVAIKIIQNKLAHQVQAGTARMNLPELLSKMEYKVLKLISDNKTSGEVGQVLFISLNTVRNHRHNISRKLDLSSENNALIKWAIEHKHLI